MPTKNYKTVVAFLESHGFEFDRTNSKQVDFYTHPHCREVSVGKSINDQAVKSLTRLVQKQLGEQTDKERRKRDPEAIKARQAVDRVRLAESIARHESEIADLVAQRDRRMDGLGRVLTGRELRAISRLLEDKERELRGWRALMTEIPTPNAHAGRPTAQHRS